MAIDGFAVRTIREKDGSNVTDFAHRIGISAQYLRDIENGRRTLKRNPELIRRIAQELNVPMSMVEHRIPIQ